MYSLALPRPILEFARLKAIRKLSREMRRTVR